MMTYLRERWALLVIALGAVYALHAFFVAPALDARAVKRDQAYAAADELDAASESVVTSDGAQSPARVARLLDQRFGDDTPIGQQNHIHALATESGLRVGRVDPDANPRDIEFGPFRLRSREIRVAATGSYEDLARFLTSIDASPMAVLEEFSLRRSDEGDDIQVSLTIRTARVGRTGGAVAEGGAE